MTKEELKKDYYADRPTEPYSDDDSPNYWANIAHYAEENLEKVFKRIEDLEKENAELKEENNRLTDTVVDLKCKVSEANSNAVIWTEELVAENKYLAKQLTKAKELLLELYDCIPSSMADYCRKTLQKVALFFKDSEVEK